jgi:hypothetical protein
MASSFFYSSKKPTRRLSLFSFLVAVVVVAFLLLIDVADATFDKRTRQAIRAANRDAKKQARLDRKEARKEARREKKAAKHDSKHAKKTTSPTPMPEQFIIAGTPSVSTLPLFGEPGAPNNKAGFAKQLPVSVCVCPVCRWRCVCAHVCVDRAGGRHVHLRGEGRRERLNIYKEANAWKQTLFVCIDAYPFVCMFVFVCVYKCWMLDYMCVSLSVYVCVCVCVEKYIRFISSGEEEGRIEGLARVSE